MVGQQQVSFTEMCPLFRGHLIHKVLWWDSNKCPLQRGVLYSEVIQYTKYYGGTATSVLYREVSFIQRSFNTKYYGGTATSVLYREVSFIQRSFNTQSTMVGQQQVSFTERCPLFRGHLIHKVLWWGHFPPLLEIFLPLPHKNKLPPKENLSVKDTCCCPTIVLCVLNDL